MSDRDIGAAMSGRDVGECGGVGRSDGRRAPRLGAFWEVGGGASSSIEEEVAGTGEASSSEVVGALDRSTDEERPPPPRRSEFLGLGINQIARYSALVRSAMPFIAMRYVESPSSALLLCAVTCPWFSRHT